MAIDVRSMILKGAGTITHFMAIHVMVTYTVIRHIAAYRPDTFQVSLKIKGYAALPSRRLSGHTALRRSVLAERPLSATVASPEVLIWRHFIASIEYFFANNFATKSVLRMMPIEKKRRYAMRVRRAGDSERAGDTDAYSHR